MASSAALTALIARREQLEAELQKSEKAVCGCLHSSLQSYTSSSARTSLTFAVCMQLFAAESEYLQADHSQCGSVLKVRRVPQRSHPTNVSIAARCTHVKHCSSTYMWRGWFCNTSSLRIASANNVTIDMCTCHLNEGL